MSNLVYIAACFPEEKLNTLIKNNDIDDIAANVFGQKICRCLASFNSSIHVINEHKNVRFPFKRKLIINKSEDVFNNIYYHSYRYLNVLYFERFSKARKIKRMINAFSPDVVVVYSMHTPYLKPVISLKKKYNYKIVVVVPDLPEYMSERKNLLARFLKKKDIIKVYSLSEKADGYIVLSKHMINKLPCDEKNTLVIEGVADDFSLDENDNTKHEKYILYSGSVSTMYGLPEFVNNYIKADIEEELYICGSGSYVEELKRIIQDNQKIKYLGVVNRTELIELQRKASLLINPRSGMDTFTMYSFPSKTMEYLSSGTPVMMERLKGIPDEYYDYIIEVEKGEWINSLKKFSSEDKNNLYENAKRAKQFIKKNKTVEAQSNRIQQFIEEL
jgi:hypothetical protein